MTTARAEAAAQAIEAKAIKRAKVRLAAGSVNTALALLVGAYHVAQATREGAK